MGFLSLFDRMSESDGKNHKTEIMIEICKSAKKALDKQCVIHSIPYGKTAKTYANSLLYSAQLYAEQINEATSVFDFTYSYEKLIYVLNELIWLNEKKKVSMYPTPRKKLKDIVGNIELTINKFITQAIESINAIGIEKTTEIDSFLDSINENDKMSLLLTKGNIDLINKYRQQANNIRNKLILQKLGSDENLDCSNLDEMDVIVSIERHINFIYKDFITNGMSPEIGKRLLHSFCSKCISSNIPLAAQIRLEDLINEYEPKFSTQNPLYTIDNMNGHDFEEWCATILRKNGFINVEVTKGSGDQGVDILAEKDEITYAIQCKCYSTDLGNKPIQEVNAGKAIYHRHIGVVMTNRYFTPGAQEAAKATGVLLWDRDKLLMMINFANKEDPI